MSGAGLPDQLPPVLVRALSGDPAARLGQAIVVATTDDQGRPHFALLSHREVLAVDACALRLATYTDSRTSFNMRRRQAVSLCLVEDGAVWYVKARTHEITPELPGHPGVAAFAAVVEEVKRDAVSPEVEKDAVITSPITYRFREPETGAPAVDALRQLP